MTSTRTGIVLALSILSILSGALTWAPAVLAQISPEPEPASSHQFEGIGRSSYKALVVSAKQRFNSFMRFQASWTFSHAIDYIPDAIFDVPFAMDQNNIEADKGNSLQDQRHKFVFSGIL